MIENTPEHALQLDLDDPLKGFRQQFFIPTQKNGQPEIYFVGNSLGLQPLLAREYLEQELNKWQNLGVKGHFDCEHPWMPYHEFLTEQSAAIVGAKPQEVVCMNSLTVNLHLMMVSFYRPSKTRYKIVIEAHAFPSDHYAVESQIRHHGLTPEDALILWQPKPGQALLDMDDLKAIIEQQGDEIALLLLPGVQYYTGQLLDMQTITTWGHQQGITVGFDLAHAAGNVPLELHQWGVDFACWCNYKYLNSGPGAVAGCFIHQKHAQNTEHPRFAGWWGHDKTTRFEMKNQFHATPTAEGWQLSNPPIFSLAAIRASLAVFEQVGGMAPLREKSLKLTGYLEQRLEQELGDKISIITPKDPHQRGCQLSISINSQHGKAVFNALEQAGCTTDWREPNVIRCAPVPLYNGYSDVYEFVQILKACLR